MKMSEILRTLLKSETVEVRSYCEQIIKRGSDPIVIDLLSDHTMCFLLPAFAHYDNELLVTGVADKSIAMECLRNSLPRIESQGDDAELFIGAIPESAWKHLLNKYKPAQKIELEMVIFFRGSFLFIDSNRVLQMNLTGQFGKKTHHDFHCALSLAPDFDAGTPKLRIQGQ